MRAIAMVVYLWILAFICIFMSICKKRTPTVAAAPFEHDEAWYARACYAGNVKYLGVQEVEGTDRGSDLVMFNAPSGSTLAVKAREFSAARVIRRVEEHMAVWGQSSARITGN